MGRRWLMLGDRPGVFRGGAGAAAPLGDRGFPAEHVPPGL